ncbi:MAG: DUF523 domain-containing protein [Clostridia bacterium]|nr:DUF523 domain-containing protein [Clostridia bacterium]
MEKILVSACLLGTPCRYDGASKPDKAVISLENKYLLVPICPECLGGLKTPRIPSEIRGDRVIRKDGIDVTAEYNKGTMAVLEIARQENIKIAVLKSKSPACGKGRVYDGTFTKTLTNSNGILADLLIKNGIKVIDESELNILNEDNCK